MNTYNVDFSIKRKDGSIEKNSLTVFRTSIKDIEQNLKDEFIGKDDILHISQITRVVKGSKGMIFPTDNQH